MPAPVMTWSEALKTLVKYPSRGAKDNWQTLRGCFYMEGEPTTILRRFSLAEPQVVDTSKRGFPVFKIAARHRKAKWVFIAFDLIPKNANKLVGLEAKKVEHSKKPKAEKTAEIKTRYTWAKALEKLNRFPCAVLTPRGLLSLKGAFYMENDPATLLVRKVNLEHRVLYLGGDSLHPAVLPITKEHRSSRWIRIEEVVTLTGHRHAHGIGRAVMPATKFASATIHLKQVDSYLELWFNGVKISSYMTPNSKAVVGRELHGAEISRDAEVFCRKLFTTFINGLDD